MIAQNEEGRTQDLQFLRMTRIDVTCPISDLYFCDLMFHVHLKEVRLCEDHFYTRESPEDQNREGRRELKDATKQCGFILPDRPKTKRGYQAAFENTAKTRPDPSSTQAEPS